MNLKNTLIVATLLTLLGIPPATAQGQPGEVYLPLDSCAARALRNQAAVRNAVIDVQMARETRRAALTKYFPTMSVAAGYFRSLNPLVDVTVSKNSDKINVTAEFDGTSVDDRVNQLQQAFDNLGIDVDIKGLFDNLFNRLTLDAQLQMFDHGAFANAIVAQPVFAGGRIINGNRLAQLGIEAAELQLVMTQDEVVYNVEERYWQIVSLNEKMRTVVQAQQMLDTLARDAEAACKAGVVGRGDLLKVRLKRNEMEATRVQLANGIELATLALCQYMGTPYDTNAVYRFDTLDYGRMTGPGRQTSPEEAVARRRESRLLAVGTEAARLQKAITLGEALPQVSMSATYGANNLMGNGLQYNGLVMATVNVPLSAWWETAHKSRKEQLAYQQSRIKEEDMRELMMLQTRQAWNEMSEAYTQIALRKQAVEDARENLAETQHYYAAGMQGMSDLLEAQTLLQQAQNSLTDQAITYLMKTIRYRQLTNANH